MGYLRSSAVHHLGPSPWSFIQFAKRRVGKNPVLWSAPPYQRPAYHVFQEHCEYVLAKYGIQEMFRQTNVEKIEKRENGDFRISTDADEYEAHRVVLSIGQAPPNLAAWGIDNPRVQHLLSENLSTVEGRVIVVGAGMTACQFCLANLGKFEKLTLIAETLPRVSDFDADPCWIGPKCRTPKFESMSVEEKRRVVSTERLPGTVNQTILTEIRKAIADEQIEFRPGRVMGAEGDKVILDSGELLSFDQAIMGTGFQATRPGGQLVDDMIEEIGLPTTPCGYPLLSESLEWTEGLYATGGLAELRLGPVSRNITGGRSAAKLILKHAYTATCAKEMIFS